MNTDTVWLAGGTGLIGHSLAPLLLAHPRVDCLVALGRRPLALAHPKLLTHTIHFDKLDSIPLPPPTAAVCLLGTTRKAAGSDAAFREVDYEYVLAFARAAQKGGATRLVVVSSHGADPSSRSLYLRTKGEMERDVSALGLRSLVFARPSVLVGAREVPRLGESIVGGLAPILRPFSFAPIDAAIVARALASLLFDPREGTTTVSSRELHTLGRHASTPPDEPTTP